MIDLLPIAHVFGAREDLPLPEWLFAWGVAVVLIASFAGLSLLWQTARLDRPRLRPAPGWISGLLVNRFTRLLSGSFAVFLLGLTVWAGLEGTESVTRNFAVDFVFITFWLGGVVLSVLFGGIMRAFNPWRAIALASSRVFGWIAGQTAPAPFAYPEKLGRWPAAIGLVGFLWLELIYGIDPRTVAVATLVYSAVTFAGMALFGIEKWLDRGEAFSVYFGMFARLAPLTVVDGRLMLRRPLSGVSGWAEESRGSIAVMMVAIGGTSYDGSSEGLLKAPLSDLIDWLVDAGLSVDLAAKVGSSVFLVGMIGAVSGVFWLGAVGMRTEAKDLRLADLGAKFGHAFIPIALAYLVAHYFSLFIQEEQAQFSYLLSDPLGDGSDIFGTADGGINYGIVSADAISYIQAGSIAIGHGIGLVLGHDKALALFEDHRKAMASQLFMLAVMVSFSIFGLLLLFKANS